MSYRLSQLMFHLHGVDGSDTAATPECPPFLEIRQLTLNPEPATGMQHVADCDWCQRLAAANWSARCPSPGHLAAHAAGDSVLGRAIDAHIAVDECAACRRLLARYRRQHILSGVRDWVAAAVASVSSFAHLPEAALATAAAAEPGEPWRLQQAFPKLGVRLTLYEDEGDLWATLDSPRDELAGARYTVDLIGEDDSRTAELTLAAGAGGCEARHLFGPVAELGRNVGHGLSILVSAVHGKGN